MVRRPSVRRPSSVCPFTMLKDLLLQNRLANQSQILCKASLGRGNESLFAASGSHDQYGRHAHIQYSPVFFSPARSPPRTIFLSPPRIRAPVRSQSHRGILLFRRGSAADPRWSPKIPVLFHRGSAVGLQCHMMTS